MLLWSVEAFLAIPDVAGVTLVLPANTVEAPPVWLAELEDVDLVAGGTHRTDSVRLGLQAVPSEADLVAVHDGARPIISREAITRVFDAAGPGLGAVAGRPVTDSLKEVDGERRIVGAPDRARLWRAETPQAFALEDIIELHKRAESDGVHMSDCAGLCQLYGLEVVMLEIEGPNPKITRPEDMDWVGAYLETREASSARDG
jgi:2-C-methyl-D-erythritol 4-phosphate cytidylyltransferase